MIAQQLKEFRLRAGLTHQEMADLFVMNRVHYVMCETGKRKFPRGIEKSLELMQNALLIAERILDDKIQEFTIESDSSFLLELRFLPGALIRRIEDSKRKLQSMEREFSRNAIRYKMLSIAFENSSLAGQASLPILKMLEKVKKKIQKNSPLQQEKLNSQIKIMEAQLAICQEQAERLLPANAK